MVSKKKVERFEDLIVYKNAIEIVKEIYKVTNEDRFKKDFALCAQIRRSSISIVSNIAEGFDRGTNKDFTHFLYIAKGSASEVRAQINVAYELRYVNIEKYENIYKQITALSKQLSHFISYLMSTKIIKRGAKSNETK